jgi:transglutaminase-like putative cysteine protease
MRPLCWAVSPVLLALALAGSAAHASQHDLPDWVTQAAAAKVQIPLGTDPKAAVLLEDKQLTINADGTITERYRQVIKILEPQGRDYAHPVAWFNKNHKLVSFHVWSIGPDGHQYTLKKDQIFEGGAQDAGILYDDVRYDSAVVPGSDPGGIVAYEYVKKFPVYAGDDSWDFQNPIPTVKSVFEVDLPPGWHESSLWHNYASVAPTEAAPNQFRWELDNIPGIDLDSVPMAPAEDALSGRMEVYFASTPLPASPPQLWSRIGEWYTPLLAPQSEGPQDIASASRSLTSQNADFMERIRKVAAFMQQNIRYVGIEIGIGGLIPHPAEEVYRNQYGDCKDKVTLMIAMLDAVGVRATWVMVDTDRGVIDPKVPSLIGDHMITAIEIPPGYENPALKAVVTTNDGKRYLIFDPTNEYVPIGLLPNYLQGSTGLLMSGAESQAISLPVLKPTTDTVDRTADFTLAADGTLTGTVTVKRLGASSYGIRRFFVMSSADDQLKSLENGLRSDFASFTVGTVSVQNAQTLSTPMIQHYQVTASSYAKHAGSLLLVRPRVVGSDAFELQSAWRKYPVEFDGTGDWRDTFNVKLPAGYTVDDLPDPVNLDMGFASYHSDVKADGDVLRYSREYVVKKLELDAADYSQLRNLEGKIYADENRNAVLKKTN